VALFVLAGIAIAADRFGGGHTEWLPITITLLGMVLIVTASGAMAAESQLSASQIFEKIDHLRARIQSV
jgi:hypothetical protein